VASKICKLSALFNATKSIGATFAPTGSVVSTDLFGNPKKQNLSGIYSDGKGLKASFDISIPKKSVFSSGISLEADFSCKTLDVTDDEAENCGKLDFSQTCSSAHIVTIGL